MAKVKGTNANKLVPAGRKRCSRCLEIKAVAEFNKNASRGDGLDSWCRACKAKYNATEAGRESDRRYKATEAGRAVHRAANRRYAATGAGRERTHRQNVSDAGRERKRHYAASEAGREASRRYAASEAGRERAWWRNGVRNADAVSPFTVADFDRLLANQGGRCAVSGCPVEHAGGKTLHVDHEHRDGKIGPVRGLVCNSHNVTAARVGDGAA